MGSLPVSYFDGKTAQIHHVTLGIDAGHVTVHGESVNRDEPFAAVEITDQIGQTPRLVRFSDGAYCEITDLPAFAAVLAEQGIPVQGIGRQAFRT